MTRVLLLQSRKEFALEVIYCSNYREMLLVTVTYDVVRMSRVVALITGTIGYRPLVFCTLPEANQVKGSPFGPLCDRCNENQLTLFCFRSHFPPERS